VNSGATGFAGAGVSVADSTVAVPNLDRIIRGLLYVYVCALPFKQLLFIERNGFIVLGGLLVLWCVVNRRNFFVRTPIDMPLLAFVGWVLISILFATIPAYSFKEFAKLLQQGLLFYVVVYFFKAEMDRTRLVWILVGVMAVVSVYGIYQFVGLIGMKVIEGQMMLIESFLPAEVWLTTYLVMLVPLGIALAVLDTGRWVRYYYATVTALATLCLLLTYSRAGLLSLLCEVLVLAWLVRRQVSVKALAVSTLVVLLASLLFFQYGDALRGGGKSARGISSMEHRMEIWKSVTSRLSEHPIFGIGYGKDNLKQIYERSARGAESAQQARLPGVRNISLELALGVGFPGLALFLWLMRRIVTSAVATYHTSPPPLDRGVSLGVAAGVAGMAVRLMFDQMFIGTLAILFWVLVAMAMAVHVTIRDQAQLRIVPDENG